MACTCNALDCGPGFGHESYCGKPEIEEDEDPMPDEPCPYNVCDGGFALNHMDCLAEGRLQARDYDAWAAL